MLAVAELVAACLYLLCPGQMGIVVLLHHLTKLSYFSISPQLEIALACYCVLQGMAQLAALQVYPYATPRHVAAVSVREDFIQ